MKKLSNSNSNFHVEQINFKEKKGAVLKMNDFVKCASNDEIWNLMKDEDIDEDVFFLFIVGKF